MRSLSTGGAERQPVGMPRNDGCQIMIPITSFAGKTVAVFGLGGSGLASCHALKAGGADVIASDDGVDRLAEATQAGFITADLRKVSWAHFAALVLTPGAPLTHPAPHWTVLAAQQAGVEVIGDIELFCRERRRHAPYDPSVGILLNVSEDHIDRHGTLAHYAAVKACLVAGVQPQGTAIVGVADGWSRNTADRIERAGQRVVRISVKNL